MEHPCRYIVADCNSVEVMVLGHKYLNDTLVDAVAQSLNADYGDYVPKYGVEAVKKGKVAKALKNLYVVLMRLASLMVALYVTPLAGLGTYTDVKFASGCTDVKCKNDSGIKPAIEVTRDMNVTVLFVGLDLFVEAESLDRSDLSFPRFQQDLVEDFADANVLNNVPQLWSFSLMEGLTLHRY
ncbi:hypothetical protein IFM89_031180 [Coptis chinensis]|uniref:Glycoside hydrolase family 3 C-terminal domain-containing protein n=1 Tax=Coptis chinensis TaxID=261450 RepID=A0A835ITH4_9MAGN|nr:hypothetical protein IFM89_031180 [Coptis chinensis]